MGTEIVLGVLIVAVFIAVSSSVKHFRGEGGCCGGSAGPKGHKVRRKHLRQVADTKRIHIEGMHCERCRRSVENGLNSLEQVSARVDLKQKLAVVELGEELPDDMLTAAIENLGYQVAKIE